MRGIGEDSPDVIGVHGSLRVDRSADRTERDAQTSRVV
jgi:hypothetical protein